MALAVAAAQDGDTIEVANSPIPYSVSAVVIAKKLHIRSQSLPLNRATCVLDGGSSSHIFQVLRGYGPGNPLNDDDIVIEGFTLQNGAASANYDGDAVNAHGGAIRVEASKVTIRDCTFVNNVSKGRVDGSIVGHGFGGALSLVSNIDEARGIVEGCTFATNQAIGATALTSGGNGIGGAVYIRGSFGKFMNCEFSGNTAEIGGPGGTSSGGAVSIENSGFLMGAALLSSCRFSGNEAAAGGAISSMFSVAQVANSLMVNNTATTGNGGACCIVASFVTLINNSMAGNTALAGSGGAICADDDISYGSSAVDIWNTIVWGNDAGSSDGVFVGGTSAAAFDHSNVQDVSFAPSNPEGNISVDPLFVQNPSAPALGNLRLQSSSLCIDAGNDSNVLGIDFDLDGVLPRMIGTVDIGAYEYFNAIDAVNSLKADIDELVAGGVSLPAQGRPLKVKLDHAVVALNNGDIPGAIARLQDFISQVTAMVSAHRLTTEQGDDLKDAAQLIISLIAP